MFNVSPQLRQILKSDTVDLVWLVEFFDPRQTDLRPANALRRFSNVHLDLPLPADCNETPMTAAYECLLLGMSDITINVTEQVNTCSLTLSNFNQGTESLAAWVLNNPHFLEGMRVVIRFVSERKLDEPITRFVGRVAKPAQLNRKTVTVDLRQDLGDSKTEIPPHKLQKTCPLQFKSLECIGATPLANHSAAFQAATRCNKLYDGDCKTYANQKNFKGIRYNAISGTFTRQVEKVRRVFFFFKKKKKEYVTAQFSSQDDTSYGTHIRLVMGRAQVQGLTILHVDEGGATKSAHVLANGKCSQIANIIQRNPDMGQPTETHVHLGEHAGTGTQLTDPLFPQNTLMNGICYVTTACPSANPDTGDPAADITAVVFGEVHALPGANGQWSGEAWSDNPAAHVRHLLKKYRGMPDYLLDDASFSRAFDCCNRPRLDVTETQVVYYPTSYTGANYNHYCATGVYNPGYYDYYDGNSGGTRPEDQPCQVTYYDTTNPQTITQRLEVWRKRYTSNFAINDGVNLDEFLYRVLLPSFDAFLTWNQHGQLGLKCRDGARSTFLRANACIGEDVITVENVFDWLAQLDQEVLIGAGLVTSEVRTIAANAWSFSPLNANVTSTAVNLAASSATLTGGSATTPYATTFTLPAITAGTTYSVLLDGIELKYTATLADSPAGVAWFLTQIINAHPQLSRYLRARHLGNNEFVVEGALGLLELTEPLGNDHQIAEEAMAITANYGMGAGSIGIYPDTVNWPNASDSLPDRVAIKYREAIQDFSEAEYYLDDDEHQVYTNDIKVLEINGGAIDNEDQARRIALRNLKRYLDLAFVVNFRTSRLALLHEEEDLVSLSDPSGSFVNLPITIERISIGFDFKVSIQGRQYSSRLFDDNVGRSVAPLSSLLLR